MGFMSITNNLDLLRGQGHVVLKNLATDEQIEQVYREADKWFEKTPKCQGHFYGWDTTRFGSVLTKAPASQQLATHPTILSIMKTVLGPHCDWFQLNLGQCVRIHPGATAQPPHRDEDMWPGTKAHEYLVNVMWALDDFTPENGATMIWPRSQFEPMNYEMDPGQAICAEMPRGSAAIFLGSVTHCGGPNVSTNHRTGIIFSYCLGWLKSYENQFLAYPPNVAQGFSKEIQDLIGYRIHRPNLGGYENNCPSVLLQDNPPETLAAVDALPPHLQDELERHLAQPETGGLRKVAESAFSELSAVL